MITVLDTSIPSSTNHNPKKSLKLITYPHVIYNLPIFKSQKIEKVKFDSCTIKNSELMHPFLSLNLTVFHSQEHFHCVVVCVGSNPESPLVKHLGITHNAFAWNYQSFAEPTIFRIGAAAGDRFIR